MSSNFMNELAALIVSCLLIVMMTILLVTRVLVASDPLIDTVVTAILSFWLLSNAFKWGPPQSPQTVPPSAPPPASPPLSREQSLPPSGGAV